MKERDLNIHEIETAIRSDEIIEHYPNDYPLPSVLLLGMIDPKDPLHIVCAPSDLGLIIIIAYRPNLEYWESN